jgi:hypothetical protein
MRHAVVVIQRAVWLYRWFTLRLSDAEDLGRARDRRFVAGSLGSVQHGQED